MNSYLRSLIDVPAAAGVLRRSFGKRTALFCLAMLALAISTSASAEDRPQQLFDGRTLNGWRGDLQYWRVEAGAIVGEIPPGQTLNKNTWLVWSGGELRDFDLRVQVKLTGLPAANSGIQFRCQVESVDHVNGYQADLDMGAVWLGRIYDEHGRALITERGTRVEIAPDGTRRVQTFAPAAQYAVLFRERDWNDYRIVAIGDRIAVYVNGTLFSELRDQQEGERDLVGQLAFQLHSGPETRVEFRHVELRPLTANDDRLGPWELRAESKPAPSDDPGVVPRGADGKELNLGFEAGDLRHWEVTGNAFQDQPVKRDGIAQRWQGQISNKQGEFFIGGYEIVQDAGVGTLTSVPFVVTHPYGSFLVGGGEAPGTRVELLLLNDDGQPPTVIATAAGKNQEQMRRVAVDLRPYRDRRIAVRVIDENPGGWGHINFDDFRLHDTPPVIIETQAGWRSTFNPLLQHLVPNPITQPAEQPGVATVAQMHVPRGFSVEVIAAEPDLHQPMAFTFDNRGRLWVVEGYCYPQRRPEGEGLDRIVIFADTDHDGTFETRTVFAEGLNLVSGLEVGYGGVWVGAAPELLFIPDRNHDDRPDGPPEKLLDGFGYADTHETLNSFLWGPDGWLYGNQGVFNASQIGRPGAPPEQRVALSAGVWRYHPIRREFEVFAHGGSNQWGLDYDEAGQIFMTYCRSFWGRGDTTHVMQGAHYWNQVNAGYAPFINAQPVANRPWMVNYLLASARYGHGEGGSGKPGSNDVYGGHSHVGTMIYLGDNWPASYRNRLFTHNLHGHQINQQENRREAGGYQTVHAGADVLFCADQRYIAVDLQYGPDGAVYISDWYDQRHCHNPNAEEWDRENGRLYRMKFDATWKPVVVDYLHASDETLAAVHSHRNEWHVRAARLELAGRAAERPLARAALAKLRDQALKHAEIPQRLRAIWTLHSVQQLDGDLLRALLADGDEYLRGWAIQLGTEQVHLAGKNPERPKTAAPVASTDRAQFLQTLVTLASKDPSLFVCRYLASAVPRFGEQGWAIAEALCQRPELAADRDLPLLLWHGLAPLAERQPDRALRLAGQSRIAAISDYLIWYTAKTSAPARETLIKEVASLNGAEQRDRLALLQQALQDTRHLPTPSSWKPLAPRLYQSTDPTVAATGIALGVAFDDPQAFQLLRQRLQDQNRSRDEIVQALRLLGSDPSPENRPLLLGLLARPELAATVIPLLSRYNDPAVAEALLTHLPTWQGAEHAAAMEALCGRVRWAQLLLDRVAAGKVNKDVLTAFFVRQMANLGDASLNERIEREWGRLGGSSAERKSEIASLVAAYKAAPLWAYNDQAGAGHFKKLCAQCHQPPDNSAALAPKLTGSGAKGIEYLVENILDPNAVIGRDFQARVIVTHEGRVITGLVEQETPTSITIRTLQERTTVANSEIDEIKISTNSFMPEGLLKPLNDRERLELLKFLMRQ